MHVNDRSDNLLFDLDNRLKVIDFNCSRNSTGAIQSTGEPRGAQLFRAPEMLEGHVTNTAATDMWSAGLVLYELSAAVLPYCKGMDYDGAKDWDVKSGKSPEACVPLDEEDCHPEVVSWPA